MMLKIFSQSGVVGVEASIADAAHRILTDDNRTYEIRLDGDLWRLYEGRHGRATMEASEILSVADSQDEAERDIFQRVVTEGRYGLVALAADDEDDPSPAEETGRDWADREHAAMMDRPSEERATTWACTVRPGT